MKLLPKKSNKRLIQINGQFLQPVFKILSRHFTRTFIEPSVEKIMNRAQMEHYNILKPSLERFGKCQWNIKEIEL